MVIDFISCALKREGLERTLNITGWHLSPIKKDTESWVYVTVAREKRLRVGYAGGTMARCWNGIMKELLVEWWRVE